MKIPFDDLLASLLSNTCPACGKHKHERMTFCFRDYKRLDKPLQKSLYLRMGQGYEEAVAAAMDVLSPTLFRMPLK